MSLHWYRNPVGYVAFLGTSGVTAFLYALATSCRFSPFGGEYRSWFTTCDVGTSLTGTVLVFVAALLVGGVVALVRG